jgi:hypothetical protein
MIKTPSFLKDISAKGHKCQVKTVQAVIGHVAVYIVMNEEFWGGTPNIMQPSNTDRHCLMITFLF